MKFRHFFQNFLQGAFIRRKILRKQHYLLDIIRIHESSRKLTIFFVTEINQKFTKFAKKNINSQKLTKIHENSREFIKIHKNSWESTKNSFNSQIVVEKCIYRIHRNSQIFSCFISFVWGPLILCLNLWNCQIVFNQ